MTPTHPAPARTALITGATAGIGAEFARQLASRGLDLVLVARTLPRLESFAAELRDRFGVSVEILAADLADAAALATVERRVSSAESPIDMLVNNAGFGLVPPFDENSIDEEQVHLDVLVTAPLRLTHAALQQMLPRSTGQIVMIASVAGFTPRGSYGAAKAWVLSFSRWANIHYAPRGITVTAVAPGFVHTEFHERMNADKSTVPSRLWLTAEQVVREGLRDVARGRAVSVPSLRYKVVVGLTRVLPDRLVAKGALRGR